MVTSYEFNVAAKNAVIQKLKEQYNEAFTIDHIQTVWFAHVLGNKKAIMIDDDPKNKRMYEVTLRDGNTVLFVDVYEKTSNTVMEACTDVEKDC